MVTRRINKREKVKGRAESVYGQTVNENLIRIKRERPDLHDVRLCLYSSIKRRVENIRTKHKESSYLRQLNLVMTKPYIDRMYGRCGVIMGALEDWVHKKRIRGEMTFKELENFMCYPIDSYMKFEENANDHYRKIYDKMPWSPSHEVGKVLWRDVLLIMSAFNCLDNVQDIVALTERLTSSQNEYINMISEIATQKVSGHRSFRIDPGQPLEFEV